MEHGIELDERPRIHGGKACMVIDDYVIPFTMIEGLLVLKIRKPSPQELTTCDTVEVTRDIQWTPEAISEPELSKSDYDQLVQTTQQRNLRLHHTTRLPKDPAIYAPYFLYPGRIVMQKTLQNTTQYGSINMRIPMRQHYKSRNPILNRRRINESYASDTWFSTTPSYEGYNSAQVFYGIKSGVISHYGMLRETQGPDALLDFFRQEGVPLAITHDNSKMQGSHLWKAYCRRYWVKDPCIEPYHQHQSEL
jgi:hypothetical protein